MFGGLTGLHFLIILVIVLLLFGAPRLPALARSLGQSMKIFKSEVKADPAPEAAPKTETVDSTEAADPTSKP